MTDVHSKEFVPQDLVQIQGRWYDRAELEARVAHYDEHPEELDNHPELESFYSEAICALVEAEELDALLKVQGLQNNAQRFSASASQTKKIAQTESKEIVFTDEEVDVFVGVKKEDGTIEVVTISPEERKNAPGTNEAEKAAYIAREKYAAPVSVAEGLSPVQAKEVLVVETLNVEAPPLTAAYNLFTGASVIFENDLYLPSVSRDETSRKLFVQAPLKAEMDPVIREPFFLISGSPWPFDRTFEPLLPEQKPFLPFTFEIPLWNEDAPKTTTPHSSDISHPKGDTPPSESSPLSQIFYGSFPNGKALHPLGENNSESPNSNPFAAAFSPKDGDEEVAGFQFVGAPVPPSSASIVLPNAAFGALHTERGDQKVVAMGSSARSHEEQGGSQSKDGQPADDEWGGDGEEDEGDEVPVATV